MTECQRTDIRDRLPEYVHGTLGARERAEVEAHVASCAACRDEVALLRTARGAIVRRTPSVSVERVSAAVNGSRVSATMPNTRPSFALARKPVGQLLWRVAAALGLAAMGAVGYWMGTRQAGTPSAPTIATVPAPLAAPKPVAVPLQRETIPAPAQQVATLPAAPQVPPVRSAPAGLSFGGGVSDLPAGQVDALLKELDGISPAISADPEPDVDLGSGT